MDLVKLGITGHRFLAEEKKIIAGLDRALAQIRDHYPEARFRVLSPLAPGADCLFAERALRLRGAELHVPLPQEGYLQQLRGLRQRRTFLRLLTRAKKVIALMPAEANLEDACHAAGIFIIENCDILFAIWDGKPPQGRGGTGEIVELARQRGLPIVWVHAGNRTPVTEEPSSLGEEQGRVTYEGFPQEWNLK